MLSVEMLSGYLDPYHKQLLPVIHVVSALQVGSPGLLCVNLFPPMCIWFSADSVH